MVKAGKLVAALPPPRVELKFNRIRVLQSRRGRFRWYRTGSEPLGSLWLHTSIDFLTALKPLSLLLKLSPLVDELSLYDVVNTPGVATDLSHISSKATVSGYLPPNDGGKAAFKDADIIIIPAGIPRMHMNQNTDSAGRSVPDVS
jgi:hypothetical protein